MNVNRFSDQRFTKYPFTDSSTITLQQGISIPVSYITALMLQVSDPCICYLYKIQAYDADTVGITFKSSSAKQYSVRIVRGSILSIISNELSCPAGSILYDARFFQFLMSVLGTQKAVTLSRYQAQLLPECITIMRTSGCQAISVDNTLITQDTTINFCGNAVYDISTHSVNIFGDLDLKDTPSVYAVGIQNGTTSQVWSTVVDKQLLIKPAALSDLRIVTGNDKLQLRGVANE